MSKLKHPIDMFFKDIVNEGDQYKLYDVPWNWDLKYMFRATSLDMYYRMIRLIHDKELYKIIGERIQGVIKEEMKKKYDELFRDEDRS